MCKPDADTSKLLEAVNVPYLKILTLEIKYFIQHILQPHFQ